MNAQSIVSHAPYPALHPGAGCSAACSEGWLAVLAGAAAIRAQGRGHSLALAVGKDKGRPAEVGSAGDHGEGAAAKGTDVDGPQETDVDEVEDIGVGKGTTKVWICHKG
jgi:hypothetical protein